MIKNKLEKHLKAYMDLLSLTDDQSGITKSSLDPLNLDGNPKESLSAYCKHYCLGIFSSQAQELINKGRLLMTQILEGDKKPSNDRKQSQEELSALSWFLMNCAITQKQGHDEGAFMIEDRDQYLYNFLVQSPGAACGTRSSSHLVGRSPKDTAFTAAIFASAKHHGVDVIEGLGLPAEKRTILFEMVDNKPVFIQDPEIPEKVLYFKLENFSPFLATGYGYDATMHGYELFHAQYNKKVNPGSDDLPSMRKERVPAHTLKKFEKIIQFIKNNTKEFKGLKTLPEEIVDFDNAMKKARLWGLSYMYLFINEINKDNITFPQEFQQLVADLKKDYANLTEEFKGIEGHLHLERRTGREVILTRDDLVEATKSPRVFSRKSENTLRQESLSYVNSFASVQASTNETDRTSTTPMT